MGTRCRSSARFDPVSVGCAQIITVVRDGWDRNAGMSVLPIPGAPKAGPSAGNRVRARRRSRRGVPTAGP